MGRLAGDLAPVEDDPPGVGRIEAGEAVKARRLAGAVGAEQAEDLPFLGGERDGVERGDAGEALGEPHYFEDPHQAARRRARRRHSALSSPSSPWGAQRISRTRMAP